MGYGSHHMFGAKNQNPKTSLQQVQHTQGQKVLRTPGSCLVTGDLCFSNLSMCWEKNSLGGGKRDQVNSADPIERLEKTMGEESKQAWSQV